MKLGPVIKIDKRDKAISNDVMKVNCDVIVIFLIYGQFLAIRKPDSGLIVSKTYISLILTYYLTKTENKTKKSLAQFSHYCFD